MIETLSKILLEAGKILKKYFRSGVEVNNKGTIDLVTIADLETEVFIKEKLGEAFPDFPLIGEETAKSKASSLSGRYFLLDPLDGTTNFAHGLPWFAISLALMEDLEPLIGLIYNPITEEFFYAERGKGAYLNGKPIKVSSRGPLINCLLATGFPVSQIMEKPKHFLLPFEDFMVRTRGVRRFGAASLDLAYVAAGYYDGFFEAYLKPWDTSAGILLVKEAGGKISDYLGAPYHPFKTTLIASNGVIHEEMVEILKDKDPESFKPFKNPLPAVDILIEYENGIVIIERKNPPLGLALPGGFVEYGETLEEAAIREAKEETNLDIEIEGILGCYSHPQRDPRFHTIAIVFVAKGKGELKGQDDAKRAFVVPKEKLLSLNLIFDHNRIVEDYLKKWKAL